MLFIFDWDGTLLDSTEKIVRCMRRAIIDVQVPLKPDHELKQIIGLGLTEAISSLYPELNAGQVDRLRSRYSAHFIEEDQVPCQFYDNALSTLEQLRDRGHRLAVATGKSRRGLDRVLNNVAMDDYFDATRCADETQSKPHPQMVYELLDELDVPADQAVMIGDTEFDMAMAHRAGIDRIAVTYGAHGVERLSPYQPAMLIDCLSQLLEWQAAE